MNNTSAVIYQIHAFEGARGTHHRIRPISNVKVVDLPSHDTTYGWDGGEGVEIINPSLPAAWHDVKDDVRSYHDIYVVMPNGHWYRQCLSSDLAGQCVQFPYWEKRGKWVENWGQHEWLKAPIPLVVIEIANSHQSN